MKWVGLVPVIAFVRHSDGTGLDFNQTVYLESYADYATE